ncbi:MAG: DUF2207 domain-containing protein [Gammaproteobacteria bacterium]|nr:DUF2207 domain-containing protein [Gammaproteobacteria bacterium]
MLVLLLSTQVFKTQEPTPFYWEFINVEIDIQENGDILVSETQKYIFTAPYTNKRYRWLSLALVDSIEGVEVFEEGQNLFASVGVENNRLWIEWQHALTPPDSHTFVIKYRVKGGLQGNKISWRAIFKERVSTIKRANVIIRLPASLEENIIRFSNKKFKRIGDAFSTLQIYARTIELVSQEELYPGEGLKVSIIFPALRKNR